MKASELIRYLAEHISDYGDNEVIIGVSKYNESSNEVNYENYSIEDVESEITDKFKIYV